MPRPSPKYAHDPSLLALGAAIRSARLERGMSQEDLAERSEIDRAYMSSIERGTQNPGVISILRIVKALDMSLAALAKKASL